MKRRRRAKAKQKAVDNRRRARLVVGTVKPARPIQQRKRPEPDEKESWE